MGMAFRLSWGDGATARHHSPCQGEAHPEELPFGDSSSADLAGIFSQRSEMLPAANNAGGVRGEHMHVDVRPSMVSRRCSLAGVVLPGRASVVQRRLTEMMPLTHDLRFFGAESGYASNKSANLGGGAEIRQLCGSMAQRSVKMKPEHLR